MKKRSKRAGLYLRVSTDEQDHALQLDELRQVAIHRGYRLVEYIDTGSGSGKHLPQRDKLMADAQRGKLDLVLVWRFDRFARSTRDLLGALESFNEWGVQFVSLREGIDTSTPTGKLVFTVVAALAEFERELIRERVRAGMSAAKRRGVQMGRKPIDLDIEHARSLRESGMSYRNAARVLGVSVGKLHSALASQP